MSSVKSTLLVPLLLAGLAAAADSPYKIDTRDNILKSARTLAGDLIALYHGDEAGEIPGVMSLPPPSGEYWFWQGSALMTTYIDYHHLTGDDTYNDVVTKGLLHQAGPNADFLHGNWTPSLGNDDQCMWASAAMLAVENKFPSPPNDSPQWLETVENAFASLADPFRHDDECGGGLRWQIAPTNVGYDIKNTWSNGCYLNLAARLARYTGNDTYAQIAQDTWDWLVSVEFIDEKYAVYDGAQVGDDCKKVNKLRHSLNSALLLQGAAFMFNFTGGNETWRNHASKLADATLDFFFPDDVAYETSCEGRQSCTTDAISFKGLVHRNLASATQLAPFLADTILPVLRSSTEAAIKTCTGGKSGRDCGFYDWAKGEYVKPTPQNSEDPDAEYTVGEQMNVLAAVSNLLIDETDPPTSEVEEAEDAEDAGPTGTDSAPEPKESENTAGRSDMHLFSGLMVALGAGAWMVGL